MRTMKKLTSSLFKFTFRFFVIIFRLYGLLPYSYSSSDRCFYPSTFWFVYSVIVMLLYILVLGIYNLTIIWYVKKTHPEYGIFFIATTFVMSHICSIVTYYVTLACVKRLRTLLNSCIRLWYLLRSECPENFDRKILSRFLFKAIVIDGSSIAGSIGIRMIQSLYRRDFTLVVQAVFNGISFAFGAMTVDLFVITAYLGAHYFRLINRRVKHLHRRLKDVKQDRDYWRLNQKENLVETDEMAKELKQLIAWHGEVAQLIQDFVQVHDATSLVMILKDFVIFVTGTFLAYVEVVTQLRQNKEPAIGTYGTLTFVSIFHFCQFYYLTDSGAIFSKRGEKTGVIINDMSRRKRYDQLDVKIESYSLELLHRSCKLWNAGMFTIDYSLMYASVATMAYYLIVSIQFRMSE